MSSLETRLLTLETELKGGNRLITILVSVMLGLQSPTALSTLNLMPGESAAPLPTPAIDRAVPEKEGDRDL